MDISHLISILLAVISGILTWTWNKQDKRIDDLEKELQQVRLTYASKEEIKEIKELIEKGFDKLESRLDKKADK